MSSAEQRFQTESLPNIDTSPSWRSSNIEPLRRVLPELSPLQVGVPMLDRIMFACSNTELKSVMIFFGLDSTPTHRGSIHERFAPLLPDSWDSRPQPGNIVRMMRTFITPPGFSQEPMEYYFATTPQGETVAKDSAAFLLQRAVDLGMPFGPILQERTEEDIENPTRAYITRIATLMALKEGPLSQVKLQERIGEDITLLAWNLRVLSERKLISYDSADPEVKGQQIYERIDLSKLPEKASILARNILKYFEINGTGNQYTIAQALGREHTQNIEKALRQLMGAGVIKPTKWLWRDYQSEAKIMSSGERLIDEVVMPLLSAYSGDGNGLRMLAEARTKLEGNPAIATAALDQYKKQRILTPEVETQRAIFAFIRENGPQRRKQILSHIGKMVHPQLVELVATRQLKTIRDGNASFYVLPETDEQPTRAEEIIIIDFNPPADLFDIQEHKEINKYRRELDTVGFWQRLQRELQSIPADKHTARSFFLQYDPRYEDWPHSFYSGIFSNHIRALWNLGIEHPWEFIRSYQPEVASPELSEAMKAAQDAMNKALPIEHTPRVILRVFNKRAERLATPQFWRELASDIQSAPSNTSIESFLWRFDPNMEGNMGRNHHHGKYYNFRKIFDKHTADGAITLLTSYRAPKGASVETQLAIREAQLALRQHLVIRYAQSDNFSDIEALQKQWEEELFEKEIRHRKLSLLKSFYSEFQDFDESEWEKLSLLTAGRVHALRSNIKGFDLDEASLASIGFKTSKYEGKKLVVIPFPAELRAAFLVHAFEQWRSGMMLRIPSRKTELMFTNGVVRSALTTLERYLVYYENQAKKKDPNTVLVASVLIGQLRKYVQSMT